MVFPSIVCPSFRTISRFNVGEQRKPYLTLVDVSRTLKGGYQPTALAMVMGSKYNTWLKSENGVRFARIDRKFVGACST